MNAGVLLALTVLGVRWSVTGLTKRLVKLMATTLSPRSAAELPPLTSGAAIRLILLRNFLVYREGWKFFVTGFLEPVFYLLSIGIGVGS